MQSTPNHIPPDEPPAPFPWAACATLFIAALALRAFRIGQEAWFVDEVVTKQGCAAPSLLAYVRDIEGSPPLYPFLIRLWYDLFGAGLESLRSFSALTGAVGGALVYLAASELRMGRVNRWLAALAFAASPMALWYGQQARAYALLASLAALWLWLVLRAMRSPALPGLVAVFAAAVAGASTHYYFPLLLIPAAAILFAQRRRRLVITHLLAFAALALLIPLLREQLAGRDYRYIPRPGLKDLASVFAGIFFLGPLHPPPTHFLVLALAIPALVLAAALLGLSPPSPESPAPRPARAFPFLTSCAFLPVLLSFAVSQGRVSYFLPDRYPILALPGFILLLFCAADRLRPRLARLAASSLLGLLFLASAAWADIDYARRCQDFDWRAAIRVIDDEWRPGDRIAFLPGWLSGAYAENGGAKGPPAMPESLDQPGAPIAGRLWLFHWEQNPEAPERRLAERLGARPGARIRVDFPNIRLREIPSP